MSIPGVFEAQAIERERGNQEGRRERDGGSGGRAGSTHTTRARKGEGVDDKETATKRRNQQLGLADDDGGGCAGA